NTTITAMSNFFNTRTSHGLLPGVVNAASVSGQITKSGNVRATYQIGISYASGRYSVQVILKPTANLTNYWRFITVGSGKFDIWSHQSITGTSSPLSRAIADSLILEIDDIDWKDNYKHQDNRKTLVSSIQNSDKVITVGNYINRTWWYPNVNGDTTYTEIYNTHVQGQFNEESSRGPTRDGRQKPDITATGTFTLATGNLTNINSLINTNQVARVAEGGLHNRNGRTSIASPCVAGAAAL